MTLAQLADRSTAPGASPWWAACLDLLSLVLLALAAAVATGGRIHWSLLGIHVSIGSWERPVLQAVFVAALRHWLRPHPSLPALAAGLARAAWTSEAARAVVLPFVTSRLTLYLVGFLAIAFLGLGPESVRYRFSDNELVNMLARWDANWYTGIAEGGYSWNGNPGIENPVVFFPAYPMLIRMVMRLSMAPAHFVGFAISLAAFYLALAYLYRLGRDYLRIAAPGAAVAFACWYPFGVFYSAIYAESLFLLAAGGAFYHAHAQQRWRTAGWGLLAGLTKPNGFLLALPLFVLFVARAFDRSAAGRKPWWQGARLRKLLVDGAAAAAPVLGVCLYSLYTWQLTGDPLAWLHGQQAWGRVYHGVRAALVDPALEVARIGAIDYVLRYPVAVLNGSAAAFALAAVLPVTRRLGVAYGLLVVLLVIPPLLAGGTLSLGRFTTALFPVFLWLAAAVPAEHRGHWYAGWACGETLVGILFFTWQRLY
jgi:hypothetical protein